MKVCASQWEDAAPAASPFASDADGDEFMKDPNTASGLSRPWLRKRLLCVLRGAYNCIALAIKFNGAQVTSPDDGYEQDVREIANPDCAIFFMCSKATHSCAPNIHWYDS